MGVVTVGDVELHVEERGEGEPALLLIAGIPAVASDWASIAEPLGAGRRVVAFDNRGSGRSGVTPGPYTIQQLAADAVGLLDALGIGRADVFGMSLGGMVAQEVAIGWPERVRRLVLGCTHAGLRHAAPQPAETTLAFTLEVDDWEQRIRALAPHAFAIGLGGDALEGFVAKKALDVQAPEGYAAQVEAVLAHDTYDRLDRIAAPTLVLTGDDDRIIPGASSRPLAERIPDARLEVIDGAGHLFFIERPAATLELLEDFLAP